VTETCYAERTDSVEDKLRLLRRAHREGRLDVALSLAESIGDTLRFERQSQNNNVDMPLKPSQAAHVTELPAPWAKWARGWQQCQRVTVEEAAGLQRSGEPVDFRLDVDAATTTDLSREVRVAWVEPKGGLREVPSQVIDEVRQGNMRSCRLLFLADVPASGHTDYLILYGNPEAERPDYITDLQVHGEGYGLEIANNHFTAHLAAQTGQVERLRFRRGHGDVPYGANLELVTGGEGHGEPPNIDWGPDYCASGNFQKFRLTAWSECPNYEIVRGPLCVQVRRWGFPHSPIHPVFTPSRCHISVTYTFFAGRPYFLKEACMETVKGYETTVIRDDEWLFYGLPFTDSLWLDAGGHLHEGDVAEDARNDMWGVGFYNRDSRDAFVALRLEHEGDKVAIKHDGTPSTNIFGRGQIWCRTPLSPGPTRLPTGSSLGQKSAYLATHYPEDGGAQIVEATRRQLVTPLQVQPASVRGLDTVARAQGALGRVGETAATANGKRAIALKKLVWEALREVRDDQLMTVDGNVADLGYIYDVQIAADVVHIVMTMPHRGRPQHNFLANPIRDRVQQLKGVRDCVVECTWEPAWTVSRLSDAGRRALGLDP